jgi:cis-3-alkyl-4-acyloxetan-2-one decarboxylase
VRTPLPHDVARGYVQPYRSWADRVANLRFVQDIPMKRTHPSYARLRCIESGLASLAGKPMLFCWGLRDWCFTPRFLAEWRRRFPDAKVLTFEKAGHYVIEDAGEEVVTAIRAFMRE